MTTTTAPSTQSTWPMVRETSLKLLDGQELSSTEYMEAYKAIFNKATTADANSNSRRQMYDAVDALLSKWIRDCDLSHEEMLIRVKKLSNLFQYLERHFIERELSEVNNMVPDRTPLATSTNEQGQGHVQATPRPVPTRLQKYKTDVKHLVDLAEMYWQKFKA